jgi:hypothetical protein
VQSLRLLLFSTSAISHCDARKPHTRIFKQSELATKRTIESSRQITEELDDLRGREVIERAARHFGRQSGQKAPLDRGFGFAFARYKNLAAYCECLNL